ncbi:uncharacterized protein ARMOST_06127 [Armillaria ostoyae]|uniref:Uncharacterized protein n=1 Tax=Armillaria ostoyae TaxID=47428 RepID=A0A284R254_ARMOS|nr:uncharacterized protein ARMOST_06127 [Armillaria ostoyae]
MNSCGVLIIRLYGNYEDDAVLMDIVLFSIAFVPAVRSRFLTAMTLRPSSALASSLLSLYKGATLDARGTKSPGRANIPFQIPRTTSSDSGAETST